MRKKPGKPLSPLVPDGTGITNAELWPKIRHLRGRLTIREIEIVQLMAMTPFDRSGRLLARLKSEWLPPESRFEPQPNSFADYFVHVYRRDPDACMSIMKAISDYWRGRTETVKAVIGEWLETLGEGSAHEIADKLPSTVAVTDWAVEKRRGRLRKDAGELAEERETEESGQK